MMHDAGLGSMWWMMLFMWVFWLSILALPIVAIVLAVRALRRSAPAAGSPGTAAPALSGTGGPGPATTVPAPPPHLDPAAAPAPPPTLGPPTPEGLAMLELDQKTVYDLVVARSGDVPQGDLVALSGFSKAKVSRVLDRLEAKGLVIRVRRGFTNRILLAPTKRVP